MVPAPGISTSNSCPQPSCANTKPNGYPIMKKLLIISEKYNQTLMLCAALHEIGVINDATSIDSIHVMPMSWWHFKIPSAISMASIPFSDIPGLSDLEPNPNLMNRTELPELARRAMLARFDCTFVHKGYFIDGDGRQRLSCPKMKWESNPEVDIEPIRTVAERINTYDQILCAPDFDGSGVSSLFRWLDKLNEQLTQNGEQNPFSCRDKKVHFLRLWAMDTKSVVESYKNAMSLDDPQIQDIRRRGDTKRVFDYWWFYNSAALFTKLQRQVGVEQPKILSKYELMTLHLINRWDAPIAENQLLHGMERWLGTGKYPACLVFGSVSTNGFAAQCYRPEPGETCVQSKDNGIWGPIGSPMSRHYIIDNLVKLGLATRHRDEVKSANLIEISTKGKDFLSKCHKSTFDPDLPFRLSLWCKAGDYEAMGRYIRTVFGKQKRFASKLESAESSQR